MITIEQAVELFVLARQADGRASRTLRDYRRVLDDLAAWFGSDTSLADLDKVALRRYVLSLRERGWSNATVSLYVRYVRAWLNWLHREGELALPLAQYLQPPRSLPREDAPLTPDEIGALLAACARARDPLLRTRDRAIILTLLDTGLRAGEFVSLTRLAVTIGAGQSVLRLSARHTKRRSPRTVVLGAVATDALTAYLSTRADDEPALWIRRDGRPLRHRGLAAMLRRRAKAAGLTRAVYPHLFRKTFATMWLDNGGDPERLRVLAGWSSPRMLEVYVASTTRYVAAAHHKAGPVDRMMERISTS